MKRIQPLSIGEILNNFFKARNLEDDLLSHRALSVWTTVVGPNINRLTTERRVARGVLYVKVISAPVRQELSMQRSHLIEAINNALGKPVITEIKFI
jgi:predicted nucleic acid-binding Zn ribbon protein